MLTTTATVVAPKVLKELIAAGSVSAARVEPGDKGLLIIVRAGMNERVLSCPRGPPVLPVFGWRSQRFAGLRHHEV